MESLQNREAEEDVSPCRDFEETEQTVPHMEGQTKPFVTGRGPGLGAPLILDIPTGLKLATQWLQAKSPKWLSPGPGGKASRKTNSVDLFPAREPGQLPNSGQEVQNAHELKTGPPRLGSSDTPF
ncbi:hypothetical protein ANANG_G00067610 [Anguilla anguilla]|uniref:Uncharacterized protein n=1 Tax=Anguilla anguilla TaxID=7936 RepID=A0A9D3MQ20_ANGAN|nr:hypothetical protein ANANG_G00067610 [Anguilla anguilla]